jgi:hypothetical protein
VKWFKHDSNASIDAKLKRLRLKYGMEGYGVYWYLLECVARTVEPHNLTFELEEDAELIAAEVNIHRDVIEEMMRFMCELGLFENAEGRVTCLKMAGRSDEYTLKLMRNANSVPTNSGHNPEKVPPIRIEKKRIEQKGMKKPTLEQIKARCREMNYPGRLAARFHNYYESNGWKVGKNPMKSWQAALANWNSKEQGQSSNEEYVR